MRRLLLATAALALAAQAHAAAYYFYSNPAHDAYLGCNLQTDTCWTYDKDTMTWRRSAPREASYLRVATAPAPVPAPAFVPPPMEAPAPSATAAPKTEIDGVMNSLSGLVKEGDALVAKLKGIVNTKPEEAQKAVNEAAQVLSDIADRASPDSELRKILLDARNNALTRRQVVATMPSEMISEGGRTRALKAWDDVLATADKATTGMSGVRHWVGEMCQCPRPLFVGKRSAPTQMAHPEHRKAAPL